MNHWCTINTQVVTSSQLKDIIRKSTYCSICTNQACDALYAHCIHLHKEVFTEPTTKAWLMHARGTKALFL